MTAVTTPVLSETGTGTPPGNVDGQAIAITVFSTVKRWGRAWLPVLFLEPKLLPQTLGTLEKLSFIHFARWSMVTELAWNGAPQPKTRLRRPHLYFESNFNGGWEEYIDAFSYVLREGMAAFWGSSYGFPGAVPPGPFKDYIKTSDRRLEASHFYSAYADSTVTIVKQALELDGLVADLRERAAELSPEQFKAEFSALLAKGQRCL
ncbi:MAG: hypothetical protein AAGC46_01275 [Solirubrobacteraceae bacterium]|nr:hypothetical protein [Patulibacter sp.]